MRCDRFLSRSFQTKSLRHTLIEIMRPNSWRAAGFTTKLLKAEVSRLLRKLRLDEGAIEAEAFRARTEDLERCDRMLALAEVRREKSLRFIAELREGLADLWRKASDQLLGDNDVPQLVAVSN
jgi:hypothetical protein